MILKNRLTQFTAHPIDKAALSLIGILTGAIAVLAGGNVLCGQSENCWLTNRPKVSHFSWQDREIGATDRAFILTFDRPMDKASVEKNLTINPSLPGKISWAGRKMAYTLTRPVPYGEKYQLDLAKAREHFYGNDRQGQKMQPFQGNFQSRDRAFAYIGTQGVEAGRLIFYNLTQQKKTILTPSGLNVIDFKFYDNGKAILFSAADKSLGFDGLRQLQLYRLPISLNPAYFSDTKPTLILDNKDYQNNQFDVTADGETLVVQRINRQNPGDFDLWMLQEKQEPQPMKVTGGDFKIAPDSQSLAIARGEGISILPLQPEGKPLDFLPKFGQLLNFSPDGTAAAVINYNTDNAQKRYQRSLFYVNNQGQQRELFRTEGSILSCQFTSDNRQLYCLLTELLPGESYQERPYFAQIDVKTGKVTPLVALADYQDTKISLAPDGLGILFDQVVVSQDNQTNSSLTTSSGSAVVSGKLWLLIPPTTPGKLPELQELPLVGFRPQWLP